MKFSSLILVSATLLFAGNASATLITCSDNGIANKAVGSSIDTGTGSSAVVSGSECGPWSGNDSNGLTIATGGYGSNLFDSVTDPDGWLELDKAEGADSALITGTGWGTTSGTFSFSSNIAYDDYLIILKYGNVYSSFLSDSLAADWGWNTDIEADGGFAISHLTVYVRSPSSVPEPAMVALLAIGIIGMVVVRRKM